MESVCMLCVSYLIGRTHRGSRGLPCLYPYCTTCLTFLPTSRDQSGITHTQFISGTVKCKAIHMPKLKATTSFRLQQYVAEFKDNFSSDGHVLFCQPCGKAIKAEQRSQVTQHLEGKKHIAAVSRLAKKQPLISDAVPGSSAG